MTMKAVRNLRALSLKAFWNCVTNRLQNPPSRLPDAAGDSDGEFGLLMLGVKCAPGSCAAEQFRQIIPRINLRISRCCEAKFGVTRPLTAKDFATLVRLAVPENLGSGRSTRYRLKARGESFANR